MNLFKVLMLGLVLFVVNSYAVNEPNVSYEFYTVKKSINETRIKVVGKIVATTSSFTVQSARTTGRILAVLNREGDHVKKKDKIFQVSSPDCLNIQNKKNEVTGDDDFDKATALRLQNLDLMVHNDGCFIVADRTGVIVKRSLEVGSGFALSDALVTIVDPKRLSAELEITEVDSLKIKPGNKVYLHLQENGVPPIEAKISRMVPIIDPVTRVSKAIVEDLPHSQFFPLESLVKAEIVIKGDEEVFSVPRTALAFYKANHWVVKKTEKDLQPLKVKLRSEVDANALIQPAEAGVLKDGDQIVGKGAIFALKNSLMKGMHDEVSH